MAFHQSSLINKGFLGNKDITLIEGNKIIISKRELAETFNEYYINIVEKSSGIKPKDISQRDKNQNIVKKIREIVKSYENHPSILQMNNICSCSFHVKEKICRHFVNEIDWLNSKKPTVIDTIPTKLIKVAVNFLTPPLTKSINSSIEHSLYDLIKQNGSHVFISQNIFD